MIVAPVTIPATYQSHVHPKFTEAYQIIVTIENNKNNELKNSIPRIRKTIPEKIPARENEARINGNQGELATPFMMMSAVEDR